MRHILGDSEVKALQSDGYNVYLYLDDILVNTKHLCCMPQARAKFKYAFEQGGNKAAAYLAEEIGSIFVWDAE